MGASATVAPCSGKQIELSDQGRSGAIRGDQGRSEAIRVHSVVIRGDQTCSRKQIMSSQLRMNGSVTRSSSRIFSNGPLSFSGPPALRSTLSSAGM